MSAKQPIYRIKIMKRIRAALLASVLAPSLIMAMDVNPYWIDYGNEPVLIQQNNNGAVQTLKFVNFVDGMLVAELDGGVGEVSLPVSESMVQTLRMDGVDLGPARRMISQENYEGALKVMRPQVYPLIKFHQVPESFTQLHVPVRALLTTLVSAGELEEAEDLLGRLELGSISTKYSGIAVMLMDKYLATGKFDQAAQVTKMLPVDGEYAGNIRSIVDAADALRAAGKYEAVIPLYKEIQKVVPEEQKVNVRMWLAYSLVLADRVSEATPIIDSIEEPEPQERLFSLYKLLQGSREHRAQEYDKALDVLTRGFVRAQTSYAWVPEMLFLIGDCYARAEDPLAARNVWTEIVILYPDSPWAASAESSLEQLPKPEQPSNN